MLAFATTQTRFFSSDGLFFGMPIGTLTGGDSGRASIAGRTPALSHPVHPHLRILAKVVERGFGLISQHAIRGGSFDGVAELQSAILYGADIICILYHLMTV
jgi:hypothetical protein